MSERTSTDGTSIGTTTRHAAIRPRGGGDALDPSTGDLSDRIAQRERDRHPVTVAVVVAVVGYVLMGALIVGLGLLLTHVLLHGAFGRWDERVDVWFVARRTTSLNTITSYGSTIGSTGVVVAVAALSVVVLALRRLWREAGLILIALGLEVTVFLMATFLVDRPRPTVPRLDASPPTSSYPSGHTAAAIALWLSLAIVLCAHIRNALARAVVWILAIAIPVFVGLCRLYRGMHHPTDVGASVVLGIGAILIALLAVRSASGVARLRDAATERGPEARERTEVSS